MLPLVHPALTHVMKDMDDVSVGEKANSLQIKDRGVASDVCPGRLAHVPVLKKRKQSLLWNLQYQFEKITEVNTRYVSPTSIMGVPCSQPALKWRKVARNARLITFSLMNDVKSHPFLRDSPCGSVFSHQRIPSSSSTAFNLDEIPHPVELPRKEHSWLGMLGPSQG